MQKLDTFRLLSGPGLIHLKARTPRKWCQTRNSWKLTRCIQLYPPCPYPKKKEVGLRLSLGSRLATTSSACNQPIAAHAKLDPVQPVAATTGPADIQLFQWATSLMMSLLSVSFPLCTKYIIADSVFFVVFFIWAYFVSSLKYSLSLMGSSGTIMWSLLQEWGHFCAWFPLAWPWSLGPHFSKFITSRRLLEVFSNNKQNFFNILTLNKD